MNDVGHWAPHLNLDKKKEKTCRRSKKPPAME